MTTDLSPRRRMPILVSVCLAVFAINLDTTIVNVALPQLSTQLNASLSDLQWVVDAYTLAFAALVLTAGSIGDRWGRRPALLTGLIGFAVASAVGAMVTDVQALIAVRFVMGAFAALIFPTTLSIITNTFEDRRQRAGAIGVWGAVTGLGVAVGPVTGGLLLEYYSWPAIFAALVPVAIIATIAVAVLVPESKNPAQARLDPAGLLLSSAAVATLVYTLIEAPSRGWSSSATIVGLVVASLFAVAFVLVERRKTMPMLDVSVFKNPAFSAASSSVTLAFFALFGFIFLITQYFQFIRGYDALQTGVRILPVAATIAVGSVVGPALASRLGTRAVVTTGLLMLGASFGWIGLSSTFTSYSVIALQMMLMGIGLGFTTAPATESILSVLPAAKAGIGSAINDATREAGGTLGVAVLGSVFTTLYTASMADSRFADLGSAPLSAASDSVGAALDVATQASAVLSAQLVTDLNAAFMHGLHVACALALVVCWVGALGALALPGRRHGLAAAAAESHHHGDLPAGDTVVPALTT